MDRSCATTAEVVAWVTSQLECRERLLERVRHGALSVDRLFGGIDNDDVIATTRVLVVLEAYPGASKVGTRRLVRGVGIDDHATFERLTVTERVDLRRALEVAS